MASKTTTTLVSQTTRDSDKRRRHIPLRTSGSFLNNLLRRIFHLPAPIAHPNSIFPGAFESSRIVLNVDALPAYLQRCYRSDAATSIPFRDQPDHARIRRIDFMKHANGLQHEHLLAYVTHDGVPWQEAPIGVVACERNVEAAHDGNIAHLQDISSGAMGGSCTSAAVAIPALDEFTFYPPTFRPSTTDKTVFTFEYYGDPSSATHNPFLTSTTIDKLALEGFQPLPRPPKPSRTAPPPTLYELAATAIAIHKHSSEYHLLTRNCYWFAAMMFYALGGDTNQPFKFSQELFFEAEPLPAPLGGSSNVLYDLRFPYLRPGHCPLGPPHPLAARTWIALAARHMHHDIVAQQHIAARTAVPLPRIHAFACGALGVPYVLVDFVESTRLLDVWNEQRWWRDGRTHERTLESLAQVMIGCVELPASPGEPHRIVPFPSLLEDSGDDIGPFTFTHAYLSALLAATRARRDDPRSPSSSSSSPRSPRAPTIARPSRSGTPTSTRRTSSSTHAPAPYAGSSTGTGSRRSRASSAPSWDPFAYAGYRAYQAHCDDEETLRALRRIYAEAVDRASGEGRRWGRVTRNSHLVSTLEIGITNELSRLEVVYRLGKEDEVGEVVEWDWYKEQEKEHEATESDPEDDCEAGHASQERGTSPPHSKCEQPTSS
ncbi:hypothetical protein ACG7TL_002935 [Trametes sanguinea]